METWRPKGLFSSLSRALARALLAAIGPVARLSPSGHVAREDSDGLTFNTQIACFRGQYAADVVASTARRERMMRAMRRLRGVRDFPLDEDAFVTDDRFALVLHRRAKLDSARAFDGATQLESMLLQPAIELAMLFRFDTSVLFVKAPLHAQRERLRAAFVSIFVGDSAYFDPPRVGQRRFLLVSAHPDTPKRNHVLRAAAPWNVA